MKSADDLTFDLIIIGGGLAGVSLACALRGQGLKIAVVEAYEINTDEQPCYDERTVALSYGSRVIFDSMGVWDRLSDCAEPIDTIHISDRGHFGVTRLTKEQEGVEALGYVLENLCIGQQLYKVMYEQDDISLFCPAQLVELKQDAKQVSVDISIDGNVKKLTGRLLVAADGNRSQVLQMLAIGSSRQDYGQSALICNVTPARKHHNVAYERFTDSGPLAFLPMKDNRCSVVWTLEPEQAEYLYALEDEDFRELLQQRFGYRLGMIQKTGRRAVYPLFMQAATQMSHRRVAIIGNAAHSVHPVAGQGFNLALRDVALLAELVVEAGRSGQDIGADILLQQYVNTREQDIQRVYRFTDVLVKTFSNAIEPLAHLRSCALQLVDLVPELKHQLGRQSMGLAGRLPRLGRGLPL